MTAHPPFPTPVPVPHTHRFTPDGHGVLRCRGCGAWLPPPAGPRPPARGR